MVHVCAVPNCSNRSDRDDVSFHRLPVNNKTLLKKWVHNIGRENLPINASTRVCSNHFVKSKGRMLGPDDVPTLNLPTLATRVTTPPSRRPLNRVSLTRDPKSTRHEPPKFCNVGINTELTIADVEKLENEGMELKKKLKRTEEKRDEAQTNQHFRLEKISSNDAKVRFYTGFSSFAALMICFNFLGDSVNTLNYWSGSSTKSDSPKTTKGRKRALSPLNEFFLTLVRSRLGLFEMDLADRFGISQSTVSRIFLTWINLLYLQLKQIPIWPPKSLIVSNMPTTFKEKYPCTRVIIDATEIFVEQPALPELQQLTFSSYKNHNTYKGVIGISPSGAVIFISDLYPGSISDKELTRRCGILDLLEQGDSVMADRGFNIEEELALIGVQLNIPPFLRGKDQLTERELIETRRIASLRIHVERAMEQLKNFHVLDRPLPPSFRNIANQVFFVCAILTNFNPSLCK